MGRLARLEQGLSSLAFAKVHSGVYTDYAYDSRNRLTSVTHKNSSNSTLSSESYTWDAASRMTQRVKDSVTTTFGYDALGQLTSESRSGYSASYTYDGNGNRLTRTVNSVTEDYTYDNGDKLEHVKIGGVTQKSYTYDAAGRTKTVVSGAGTTTLTYDFESRISAISGPSFTASYSYNGLDTRISKTENSVSQTYMRDGVSPVAPVLSDGSATFTPGISERRSSTSTYFQRGLKNLESQTGSSQTVTASREHDAFGNVLSSTGTWNGPFGYAGGFGYQEDASGLKLLGHRYYDSSTGRFLTRDPIKDGRNWYFYCGGSPLMFADATGNRAVFIGIGAGFIGTPVSGSVSIGIGIDLDNGHLGVKFEGGLGTGAGHTFGPGAGVSYDHTGKINGNGEYGIGQGSFGTTVGLATPVLAIDIPVDEAGAMSGFGFQAGAGTDHGLGAGAFAERRWQGVFDITAALVDSVRNMKETAETIWEKARQMFTPPPGPWPNIGLFGG